MQEHGRTEGEVVGNKERAHGREEPDGSDALSDSHRLAAERMRASVMASCKNVQTSLHAIRAKTENAR